MKRMTDSVDTSWTERKAWLESLDDDWGGEMPGSKAILPGAIQAAEDLLRFCVAHNKERPGVFPLEHGGVSLEWVTMSSPNEVDNIRNVEITPDIVFELFELFNSDVEPVYTERGFKHPTYNNDEASYSEAIDFITTRIPDAA
jgi:hypothetical protein